MKIKKKSKLLILSGIAFIAPLTMVAAACSSQTYDTGQASETTADDINALDPVEEVEKPKPKPKTFDLSKIENKIQGTIDALSDVKGSLKLTFNDLGDFSGQSVTIYFTPTTRGISGRIVKQATLSSDSLLFNDLEPSTTYQVVVESNNTAIFGKESTTKNSSRPVYISYFSDYSTKNSISFTSIISKSQLAKTNRGQIKVKYSLVTPTEGQENPEMERVLDIPTGIEKPLFTIDGLKQNTNYNYKVFLVEGDREEQLETGQFATITPSFSLDTHDLPLAEGVSANTPPTKSLLLKTNLKGYVLLGKTLEVLYKKATETEWKKATLLNDTNSELLGDLDLQAILDADTTSGDSPFAYYDIKVQLPVETSTTTTDTEAQNNQDGSGASSSNNANQPSQNASANTSSNTQNTAPTPEVLFDKQLMLVNPKKLDRIEIDKDNQIMQGVNKGAINSSWPNVALILFKHLEKREDIINLFYSLTHSESSYSDNYANLLINTMSQKIKDYFVAYANDTNVFTWNQNAGLFALVLDPTYTKKTDTKSFTQWFSLTVGGFNPNRGITIPFRNEKIRWTEIMADSWKLKWYDSNVKTTASRINIRQLATTLKFMLGENKARYTYTKMTPPATPTTTVAPTTDPANPSPAQPSQPTPESPKPASS